MKTLLTFIALSFFISLSKAQKYIPLPLDSAYWRESYTWQSPFDPPYYDYTEYINQTAGDTLINGLIYTKIFQKISVGGNISNDIIAVLRQDTLKKKIYAIEKDSTNEKILYDFNLNIGDTVLSFLVFQNNNCDIVTINNIDSLLINEIYHKEFFTIGCYFPNTDYSFIEGIGGSTGLLAPPSGSMNWETKLICSGYNNKTIYPDSSYTCSKLITGINNQPAFTKFSVAVFPNPVNKGNFEIKFNKHIKKGTLKIYDIFSRELESIYLNNMSDIVISNKKLKKGLFLIAINETGGDTFYFKLFSD